MIKKLIFIKCYFKSREFQRLTQSFVIRHIFWIYPTNFWNLFLFVIFRFFVKFQDPHTSYFTIQTKMKLWIRVSLFTTILWSHLTIFLKFSFRFLCHIRILLKMLWILNGILCVFRFFMHFHNHPASPTINSTIRTKTETLLWLYSWNHGNIEIF